MRKLYPIYVVLSLVLIVASCDKDDPKPDPLVGEWELEEIEFQELPAGFLDFKGNYNPQELGFVSYELELMANKEFELKIISIRGTGTGEGTWERNNNTLTLKFDDSNDDQIYKIVKVDEDDLELQIDEQWELPDISKPDTSSTEVTATMLYTFEK